MSDFALAVCKAFERCYSLLLGEGCSYLRLSKSRYLHGSHSSNVCQLDVSLSANK
jgi:hypothetical protein